MANNNRPEKWWSSTPKVIDGKFLVVAILPDGEETISPLDGTKPVIKQHNAVES